MSRSWISTTPVSTWRALRRRFASTNRNVSGGLTNNVIISSTSIMRHSGFCANWSKPQPRKMKPDQKKDLQDCITYFGNHLHQDALTPTMFENANTDRIGVMKAACKTLVKQRLCSSGMRWTPEGAANIQPARSRSRKPSGTVLAKINQYGVLKYYTL